MSDARALLTEDDQARVRALDLANFIVEAPAGAGKTELLTQRFLKLLATVEHPEEVVAITFTNKAAAEMSGRILDSLRRAAANERADKPHKQVTFALAQAALAHGEARGWRLLEHPGRLRITTIDALCSSFARQMPLLSRFGSQPRLVDDASRHHVEAARRALARLEDDDGGDGAALADGTLASRVAAALRHLDNDAVQLADLLAAMLARRDQWLRHALQTMTPPSRAEAEDGFAQLVSRDLAKAAQALLDTVGGVARQLEPLMAAARFAAGNLAGDAAASPIVALAGWVAPLAADAAALPQWRGLRALLLTAKNERRKRFTKAEGLPADKAQKAASEKHKAVLADILDALPAEAVEALGRIAHLPEPRYTDEEWATVAALSQLLAVAAADLWTVFNAAGEADFIEVARRALMALGEPDAPTDLALALDNRIRHLLVDEFQDTSPTQVELLLRLTAGWQPGDGRTLFAVGDPMQSIYRFRKADVGLFLQATRLGIGDLRLTPLRLSRNNRSQPPVVAWINDHFSSIFPDNDEVFSGAIRYRPFVATQDESAGSGVFVHAIRVATGSDAATRAAIEAEAVLAAIARARAENPQGDIAVLVRARKHLGALAAAARRAGIAFEALEIERLDERQPVQDLHALTRALFHRADRVAWLAVLRAPWCGLTLDDLFRLAGDDHAATLWSLMQDDARVAKLSIDGRERLLHLRAVLAAAWAERGRSRVRRWVEGIWLRLGGAACLQTAGDEADAEAYLDLLERMDAGGRFALDDLAREMERLYAAPATTGGRLQFMTIHHAKGLEFDTVIVPGLQRTTAAGDRKLVRWEEVALATTATRLVAAPIRRGGKKNADDVTLFDYLKALEDQRDAGESVRALYVAATRARRALHWVAVVEEKADGTLPTPSAASFLGLLWPAIGNHFAAAATLEPAAAAGSGVSAASFAARLQRLRSPLSDWVPDVFVAASTTGPSPAAGVAAKTGGDAAEAVVEESGRLASDVGTLVHFYLAMIAQDALAAWPPERIDAMQEAMHLWFGQQGHADVDAAQGVRRVRAALRTTLASEQGRWVLSPHAEHATELAVTSALASVAAEDGGGADDAAGRPIGTLVIDRTFVIDGERWIIDYKTGEPATAAERYRPQLARYAALFADERRPLRLAIFFTARGELVELGDAPMAAGS